MEQMKIISKLPINVKIEYVDLFKKKGRYSLNPLKIKIINNVFITHWGLLVKNWLLPIRSVENLIGTYDKSFYFSHWRLAIEQFLVSKFGKSLPSIKIEDDALYFTIHTPWFGYFSWLTTYLPRLIEISNKYPEATLLVPEEWNNISFVSDTLSMFPNLKMKILPNDHHAFVKNYVFAETRPWTSIFYPEHIEKVRNVFIEKLKEETVELSPIKKIYVSRKKANRRKIINEEELESYLINLGFESICFEDYSIFEQVYLMQNADVLISMHGAGLTNTLFMSPKSTLLELTPLLENKNLFRFPFWRISSILVVNYYVQFCDTINKGEKDFYSRNIQVDMTEFKENMNAILKNY